MPIAKYSVPGVVQGYTVGQLEADLRSLAALYRINAAGKVTYFDEDITKTIVGAACEAVMPAVEASLEQLFEDLKKLTPFDVVTSVTRHDADGNEYQDQVKDVQLKMGPLKKVSRIVQKAAHYAICDDNSSTLQLAKVRDILRATIVFPPAAWRKDNIGSAFIDAVDDHFGGAVVQVKNRFIEQRYPNLAALDSTTLSGDLIDDIESLFKQTLYGRDTFYRDMQLLIRIDDNKFPNRMGMKHTILELQLASSAMYGAKVFKTKDDESGHDKYKAVRSVMEYCELMYRKNHWESHKDQPLNLPDAERYYDVKACHWKDFSQAVKDMYSLYQEADRKRTHNNLDRAIDDSKWYDQAKKAA